MTGQGPRTTRLDKIISDRIGTRKSKRDQKEHGLERLKEAQLRVTRRLEKLAEVQEEQVLVLQAQIGAEREAKSLAAQITSAGAELTTSREELRVAEADLRRLRKDAAGLRFELKQMVDERLLVHNEQEMLSREVESLLRIRGDLDIAPEERGRQADESGLEIQGLQSVCQRLTERIMMLNIQMNDRDSCIHWLLLDSDPDFGSQREQERADLAQSLGEDGDTRHWLTTCGGPRVEDPSLTDT